MEEKINSIIDKFTPVIYSYAYALWPSEASCEQAIIDVMTVYQMKNRDSLEALAYKDTIKQRKKILNDLFKDTYFLCKKRTQDISLYLNQALNYKKFYELDILERSVLYLKEHLNLSLEELTFIHEDKKHRILEKIYQGRRFLLEEDLHG